MKKITKTGKHYDLDDHTTSDVWNQVYWGTESGFPNIQGAWKTINHVIVSTLSRKLKID